VHIWPSLALWGHPEDALALAFAIYGLIEAYQGDWIRTGLLFGLAIVIQPLTLLIVPIVIGLIPVRRWLVVGVEMVIPSIILLLPPLIQEWGPSTRILLRQPNFVEFNHATPWATLAPVIRRSQVISLHAIKYLKMPNGHHRAILVVVKVHAQAILAAGPGRIIAIGIACLIGTLVRSRRLSLLRVIWLAALALSLRCEFEPVMVPYYLLPGLALALVVASTKAPLDFVLVIVAAASCTVVSYYHYTPWDYYVAMTCPLVVTLACAWPRKIPTVGPLRSESSQSSTET